MFASPCPRGPLAPSRCCVSLCCSHSCVAALLTCTFVCPTGASSSLTLLLQRPVLGRAASAPRYFGRGSFRGRVNHSKTLRLLLRAYTRGDHGAMTTTSLWGALAMQCRALRAHGKAPRSCASARFCLTRQGARRSRRASCLRHARWARRRGRCASRRVSAAGGGVVNRQRRRQCKLVMVW